MGSKVVNQQTSDIILPNQDPIGYPFFSYAPPHMQELARPLKKYGFTHFSHSIIYEDHSFNLITTHPEFFELFMKEKFYCDALCGQYQNYISGYTFWDEMNIPNIVLAAKQHSNLVNGLLIIKREIQHTDMFFFASSPECQGIKSFYINNIPMLEQFILEYREKSKSLAKNVTQQRLIFPPGAGDKSILVSQEWQKNNFPHNLLPDTAIDFKFNSIVKKYALTYKQARCLQYIRLGLSAREIGEIMHRSTKDIEHHSAEVRRKFKVPTMLKVLAQLNSDLTIV